MMIIRLLLICLIVGNSCVSVAKSMDTAFGKRDHYQSQTKLGNPKDAAKFLKADKDISHLTSLSDASLIDGGSNQLRSSALGRTLQNVQERKIDAAQRYKINSKNAWLKGALAIENDPMGKTGGKGLNSSEKVTTVKIKKSCTEGVDFNVDVGLELVLDVEEEEYLSPMKREARSVDIPGNVIYHGARDLGYSIKWKKKRHGWHLHQQSYGWRVYLSKYLKIPLEKIDDTISFPFGNRGVGQSSNTHPVYDQWRIVFDTYRLGYVYKSQDKLKRLVVKDEYWQIVNEGTEKLAESNECYETGRVCLKSGVKTFLNKYDISRPCWYEKISYACKSEPKDGCAHLIKQNCQLKESECEYKIGSICLRWKRDYVCGGKKKTLQYSLADSKIYCLGGDCHTPVIEENDDFANVAHLAALNEAHKDCVKEPNGLCKNPITVFPGKDNYCKKIITGLIDCCSSMKGWGSNAKLSKCSGVERGLALKRKRGLCHRIDTFCSLKDKIFNKCLEKQTSHCCFNSKLSRIFHEQGRAQLGISWGSAESPNCRPLTLAELGRIDFSKFNWEEIMADFLDKGKSKSNKNFTVLAEGEMPKAQKDHMKTNPEEKREIRKRAEEEERRRLAKIESERLEKIRLEKLEAERLRKLEIERLEKQRVIRVAEEKRRVLLVDMKNEKLKELVPLKRDVEVYRQYASVQRGGGQSTWVTDAWTGIWDKSIKRLNKELTNIEQEFKQILSPDQLASKKAEKGQELNQAKKWFKWYQKLLKEYEADYRTNPYLIMSAKPWRDFYKKEIKRLENDLKEGKY
jgi:conjugal transfer mating pair stabilization protein TraN